MSGPFHATQKPPLHLVAITLVSLAILVSSCSPKPDESTIQGAIAKRLQQVTRQTVKTISPMSFAVFARDDVKAALDLDSWGDPSKVCTNVQAIVRKDVRALPGNFFRSFEEEARAFLLSDFSVFLNAEKDGRQITCSFILSADKLRQLPGVISVEECDFGGPCLEVRRELSQLVSMTYSLSDLGERFGLTYRYVDYTARKRVYYESWELYFGHPHPHEIDWSDRITLVYDPADKSWTDWNATNGR